MELKNRTILVVGGGSGIGRGLAEALYDRGNQVVIAGRRETALAEVSKARPGIDTIRLDLADPDQIKSVASWVLGRHPELDMIINAAGVATSDDASKPIDGTLLVDTVQINFMGAVRLTSAFVEHLKTKDTAAIVHVTSMLAYLPAANMAIYAATKAALHSYILSLRYMLRNTKVSVFEIAPPLVATALTDNYLNANAMPLAQYVAETMVVFESAPAEILVEQARMRRDSLRTNEVEATAQFNDLILGA